MNEFNKRISRELTADEIEKLRQQRAMAAAELPDLIVRDQMRKDAQEEPTLSGEIRRAIHASELPLASIAVAAGISPLLLDEFLTGERTLRSDVLDRLTAALGMRFQFTS